MLGMATGPVEVLKAGSARVVRQPGDGSCLFHSLTYGARTAKVGGVEAADADAAREAVASFIEATPDAEIGGTPLSEWIGWESGGDVPSYCARMRGAGVWGGAIEIAVFSRLLGVSVHVYEREGANAFKRISAFDAPDASAPVVRVLYSGRCHYDAIEQTAGARL
jgi:hypothetical protein